MRKLGLLLLAVVLTIGASGCSGSDGGSDADIVGTWEVHTDWVKGRYSGGTWHFYSDGTIKNDNAGSDSWTVSGDTITMTLTLGPFVAVYTGTVENGSYMHGTMRNYGGDSGTWTANKKSSTP